MRGNSGRLMKLVITGVWLVCNEGKFWKTYKHGDDLGMVGFCHEGKFWKTYKTGDDWGMVGFCHEGKFWKTCKNGDDWGMVGFCHEGKFWFWAWERFGDEVRAASDRKMCSGKPDVRSQWRIIVNRL